MRRKFEVSYSGRYLDEDDEEMIIVSAGMETGIANRDHLVAIFVDVIEDLDETMGDITSFTFTIKQIDNGQPTTAGTSKT